MKKIAVIGAGIAGLTCAYELQKQGFDVSVFESNSWVGGRMATRTKDGLAFDIGANFFVEAYTHTHALARELGVEWASMKDGNRFMFRKKQLHLMTKQYLQRFLQSPLSFIRASWLLFRAALIGRKTPFWNLNGSAKNDTTNAYKYSTKVAGKYIADTTIDGFTSTYQFHGANEISLGAMASLTYLIIAKRHKFFLCHTKNGMSDIPLALSKKVKVKLNTSVKEVKATSKGILVTTNTPKNYDAVVIASTANQTKKMYKNPSTAQKRLLSKVKYATTINVSYKIRKNVLNDLTIITVPKIESKIISEYTNEQTKHFVHREHTLINVGLHEEFAKKIIDKSDKEIYKIIGKELLRVCPLLDNIEPHDLQRWKCAMPKFYHTYLTEVKKFCENGQGDKNVFFCGDYLNSPWIEGSVRCAKRVANLVRESLQ